MSPLKFYKRVKAPPDYPGKTYNNGNCLLHHLVWWQNTGETVPKGFVLHHKNEDKFDNRFENLELLSNSVHASHHAEDKRVEPLHLTCPVCSAEFSVRPNYARARLARNKNAVLCCSISCGTYYATAKDKTIQRPKNKLIHGTASAYTARGCRCDVCKEGHKLRTRVYRAKRRGAVI